MTNLEVFTKPSDYIRHYGWTQGAAARSGGDPVAPQSPLAERFCLTGACARWSWDDGFGADDDDEYFTVEDELYDTIAHLLDVGHPTDLPKWNDAPGRTVEEVLAVLEAAEAEVLC